MGNTPWENPANDMHIEADDVTAGDSVSALNLATVWRAINLISKDVAKLPVSIWRRDGDTREQAQYNPAHTLLTFKSNEYTSSFNFIATMTNHALLRGNAYAFISRDMQRRPIGLYIINPDRIYPAIEYVTSGARFLEPGNRLFYVWTTEQGDQVFIDPKDIFHLRNLSGNTLEGYPVLWLAARSLGLDEAARDYGLAFFKNNARPNVVLKHPLRLSDNAKRNLINSWNQKYRGLGNAHSTAILEEGMSLDTVTINASDAQLLETRRFQIREIANWFGMPAHLLGDDAKVAYNSLEQENYSYLAQSLDPWLCAWEREVNCKLIPQERKYVLFCEFDRSALVRADLSSRYEAYAKALTNGWMSRDEVRRKENLNPIPDGEGEKFFIPSGVTVAGEETPTPADPPAEPASTEEEAPRGRGLTLHAAQQNILSETLSRFAGTVRRAARNDSNNIEARYRDKLDRAIRPVLLAACAYRGEDIGEWNKRANALFFDRLRRFLKDGLDADEFGMTLAAEIMGHGKDGTEGRAASAPACN